MLKNLVIDTEGPVAEAMRIGIAKLIQDQEAKVGEARKSIEAVYAKIRILDKEREELERTGATLTEELNKAKAVIGYLGNYANVIESALRGE